MARTLVSYNCSSAPQGCICDWRICAKGFEVQLQQAASSAAEYVSDLCFSFWIYQAEATSTQSMLLPVLCATWQVQRQETLEVCATSRAVMSH